MEGLPEGFSPRAPVPGDAGAVAGLISACEEVDGGAASTSGEHVLDDWHEVDLLEEAILVLAPDGPPPGTPTSSTAVTWP